MKSAFLVLARRLTTFSMGLACAMLLIASCLGMYQIVTRFVLEQPAEWTEVLIRFSLIWMVFLGIPEAFRLGSMVSIDLMHRLSPPSFQRFLDGVIALVSLILLAVMIWYGWDYAQRGKVQSMSSLESISMFWAYISIPVGAVFALFGVIGNYLEPIRQELETAQ